MSSDDYFDDDLVDDDVLSKVEAIEAAHTQPVTTTVFQPARPHPKPAPPPQAKRAPPTQEVIDVDETYEFDTLDDIQLEAINKICDDAMHGRQPVASSSKSTLHRTTSGATIQTTLFGGVAQSASSFRNTTASSSRSTLQRTNSRLDNVYTGKPNKTKKWDHTAFAKSGWKKPQTAKGKEKVVSFEDGQEEEWDDEEVEFEQFPAPFISLGPAPPMKLNPDLLAARRWIYPRNQQRRDYQFNIVKRSLFENTLVALPTGLGKTFIAGVVMLNFYTWFPEGKVIFVAPTKPLVAQQIEACHKSCGIPGSHAAELTGLVPHAVRSRAWQEKRVFFMTPQTLMNDLKSDNCDPRDIVLIVIDEAHKGTGDYAYAQIVRYMMAKNPHFRVLALTATPGGKPEAVQAIVDALHISHIEIRDERSLDLAPYLHKKHVKQHIIEMSDDVKKIQDMLSEIMKPMIQKLTNARLLHGNPNPTCLHPFSCQKALGALHGQRGGSPWAFPLLSKLGKLARIMGYLIEGSVDQCYDTLKELLSGTNESTGKQTSTKAQADRFAKDPKLQAIITELDKMKTPSGELPPHPKMDKLRMLLIEHFVQKGFDAESNGAEGGDLDSDSRVMVFTSFRHTVDLIVNMLNKDQPLIRAVPFIGQGIDKKGKKGYGQKEQLEVIKRFKAGEFNVLVSTSIGEEGLDIGEVDMIACYDAQKTPIRMLQRVGRTGRKRDGYVHVLLSEEREERNWEKADDNYKDVQHFIIKAEQLELYEDVERLKPDHIRPECVEMEMEIEEYVREDPRAKKTPSSPQLKAKKRARNDDAMRNVPDGASTGFVSVKDLLQKKKKKKLPPPVDFEHAAESDEDDKELEAGILGQRRTVSMSAAEKPKAKKLRRTATVATGEAGGSKKATKKTQKQKQPAVEELTLSELERLGQDNSEDEAIARGISAAKSSSKVKSKPIKRKQAPLSSPSPPKKRPSTAVDNAPGPSRILSENSVPPPSLPEPTTPTQWSSSPRRPLANASIVDLTTPDLRARQSLPPSSPPAPRWSSPALSLFTPKRDYLSASSTGSPPPEPRRSVSASSRSVTIDEHKEVNDDSIAWLLDDDDEEPDIVVLGSSPSVGRIAHEPPAKLNSSEVENVEDLPLVFPSLAQRAHSSPRAREQNVVKPQLNSDDEDVNMPPPRLPVRFARPRSPSPDPMAVDPEPDADIEADFADNLSSDGFPAATFAVRAPGKQSRKRARLDAAIDSSPLAIPPPSQRRLHRANSRSSRRYSPSSGTTGSDPQPQPAKRKKRKFADVVDVQKHNPWLDIEAEHSGEERSDGADEDAYPDSMLASEGDERFAGDFQPTQASPSYDQAAVYRRSLLTQAPGGNMPAFANRPVGRGLFRAPQKPVERGRVTVSSSPPREPGSEDDYQFGTFVVPDDADISYDNDSHVLDDL